MGAGCRIGGVGGDYFNDNGHALAIRGEVDLVEQLEGDHLAADLHEDLIRRAFEELEV